MATSKINNPHVPGSVLAQSTGAKTYTQHLSALYSAYLALSAEKRSLCSILVGDRVFRIMDASSQPKFVRLTQGDSTKISITSIYWSSNTPYLSLWVITTSGNSVSDASTATINETVQLVYGI